MQPAASVQRAADRLGLDICADGADLVLSRHDRTVRANLAGLAGDNAPSAANHHACWILLGIRLGLDKLADTADDEPHSPIKFRRTAVRHYHEAPSVHGDRLMLLVPGSTRRWFEAICGGRAFCRRWLQPDLEQLVVHETGKRLDILTEEEQQNSDLNDDERFQKVRRALFYQSYKVRPRTTEQLDGGRLRIFETTEGFGASRALLLPEFDYHASREYGYLAVPTRDCIIVARPKEQACASNLVEPLRERVSAIIDDSDFALTDALFQLEPQDVRMLDEPTFRFDTDEAAPHDRLLAVDDG